MNIEFTVRLPVDGHSVPFVRGLCREALDHLGVEATVIDAITLALTEACANVVQHSGQDEDSDYEVHVDIDDLRCRISVADTGAGFDHAGTPSRPGDPELRGHGVPLMQALVDTLQFQRDAEGHHRVTLEKRLTDDVLPASVPEA